MKKLRSAEEKQLQKNDETAVLEEELEPEVAEVDPDLREQYLLLVNPQEQPEEIPAAEEAVVLMIEDDEPAQEVPAAEPEEMLTVELDSMPADEPEPAVVLPAASPFPAPAAMEESTESMDAGQESENMPVIIVIDE